MKTPPSTTAASLSRLLPGGYTRSSLVVGPTSPQALRGAGYTVVDEQGRVLIDCNNDFTALIHGNAHPEIVATSVSALEDGSAFGMPTRWEDEHARLLIDRLPGAEQVRYMSSGSEAVMTALRLARAATGREQVVALAGAYHGFSDAVIATGGTKSSRGVPKALLETLTLIAPNDIAALEETMASHGEQVAAVLVDFLPNRAGLISVTAEFARRVRELCSHYGALFVDDEVINLRSGVHGIAHLRGVTPDLVVTGKLIGGGMPAGAVLGSAVVMGEFDPVRPDALEHGGTFAANPVMLRAGGEALRLFDAPAVERLNHLGDLARRELRAAIEPCGWTVRGEASLLRPFPPAGTTPAAALQRQLYWACYERELAVMPTALIALSTPMDETVVGSVVDRMSDAVRAVDAGLA